MIGEARRARHEPPRLLDDTALERVRELYDHLRTLYQRTDWTRYFSRELKAEVSGPLWRYDPDAVVDGERDGSV